MSHTYSHQNIYPAMELGFQTDPSTIGMNKSPCLHHPRFNGPCPLAFESKINPACDNCGPRKVGAADCWDPRIYNPPPGQGKPAERLKCVPKDKKPWQKKEKTPCAFPGCDVMCLGKYCGRKAKNHCCLVATRRRSHEKQFPGKEVPIEWLHRPVAVKYASQ